jgi:hypothetical protein
MVVDGLALEAPDLEDGALARRRHGYGELEGGAAGRAGGRNVRRYRPRCYYARRRHAEDGEVDGERSKTVSGVQAPGDAGGSQLVVWRDF